MFKINLWDILLILEKNRQRNNPCYCLLNKNRAAFFFFWKCSDERVTRIQVSHSTIVVEHIT